MLREMFSTTSQDLSAWIPEGDYCQPVGLTFKLGNLAKFEKLKIEKIFAIFFKLVLKNLRKL